MLSFLTNAIPAPYKMLALAAGVVAIGLFGYVQGCKRTQVSYELILSQNELKRESAYNALLKKKNTVDVQVVTEYVDKIVEVTKWKTKYVEIEKSVPDRDIVLSNGWVYVHDEAAGMRTDHIDAASASDATASGITAVEALSGIVDNYETCHKTRAQLIAIQTWIEGMSK